MATSEPVSRRAVLRAGMCGLGVIGTAAALAGCGAPAGAKPAAAEPAAAQGEPFHPASPVPSVSVETVYSRARGRPVRLVTLLPAGVDPGKTAVCVALHARRLDARRWTEPGFRRALAGAAAASAPFAVVGVDGGDNYWHSYVPGDDPLAMLTDEVPRWLAERGVGDGGLPAVAFGESMGGSGAILYALRRARAGKPLEAVAVVSPGLFLDWKTASSRSFRDELDWAAVDPIRFAPQLTGVPIGIWCGQRDPFTVAAREFVRFARPEVSRLLPGGHDAALFHRAAPLALRFLGGHLPDATGSGSA